MQIKYPCIITARLLPGVRIGNDFISIEYAGEDSEDSCSVGSRSIFRYYIDLRDGTYANSGCGGGSLQSGLEALLAFLLACGESIAYARRTGRPGENADLFPAAIADWCDQNSDELSSLASELKEMGDNTAIVE